MSGVQRFIANDRNVLVGADLAASAVKSARAVRQIDTTRAGNGRVRLAGDFSGHADALIEIEVAAGGATRRASAPAFSGVGSGALMVLAVDAGAAAQTLTYTLADLGSETTHAALALDGVALRAKAAGAAGNGVRLSVTPALTVSATPWSLLSAWPAGQAYQSGEQWSFGGLPLTAKGELDAASPRLRIGDSLEVYRPYREFADGGWRMGLSPAPARELPDGAPVWQVVGGYDVTVSDGVTSETYAAVVTFHDLAVALAASGLVEVVGVAAADRRPGGIAVIDVPLRTAAWVLSQAGEVKLAEVTAAPDAPTQRVNIRCISHAAAGAETWSVSGAASGVLPGAVTGTRYIGPVSFTIPAPAPVAAASGRHSHKFTPVSRPDTAPDLPSVCVRELRLGVDARPRTVTFTYAKRPGTDCNCATATLIGRISDACLGLASTEGVGIMDAAYLSRVKLMYTWREAQVRGNTAVTHDQHWVNVRFNKYATYLYFDGKITGFASQAAAEAARADLASCTITVGIGTVGATWKVQGLVNLYTAVCTSTDSSSLDLFGTPPGYPTYRFDPGAFVTYHAAQRDIDWMESAMTILLPCLAEVYADTAALALWDALWTEVKSDLDDLQESDANDLSTGSAAGWFLRYRATCDNIRLEAGILPKSDASSSVAVDGCWRDDPTATHWWADDSGEFRPAFTNQAWASREFGMYIAVDCESRLLVGDKVSLSIDTVDGARPYQVGDEFSIDVVAAGPAYLAGGVDGDDTLTWAVSGSVDGPLPDYALTAAEPSYHHGGAAIGMTRGGIPYALGDRFTLGIEAGQYRWRRDAGTWSAPADIVDGAVALVDGLTAEFLAGAAPSFLAGDSWTFEARQPYAPAQIQTPDVAAWAWSASGATMIVTLGAPTDIRALALARYHLPAGATVLIEGGDGSTWSESQALDVSGAVSVAILPMAWSVTHLRLTVAGATGGSIGWLWAGEPLATTYSAARCRMARAYAIQRGGAINPGAQFIGAGRSGEIAWDANSSPLTQSDLEALLAMLDHLQRHSEPMILVPHFMHPAESGLVRVDSDSIDPREYFELQPDDSSRRIISLDLALQAVHQ